MVPNPFEVVNTYLCSSRTYVDGIVQFHRSFYSRARPKAKVTTYIYRTLTQLDDEKVWMR